MRSIIKKTSKKRIIALEIRTKGIKNKDIFLNFQKKGLIEIKALEEDIFVIKGEEDFLEKVLKKLDKEGIEYKVLGKEIGVNAIYERLVFNSASPHSRTLDEMLLSQKNIYRILNWAFPKAGVIPNYIKELDNAEGKYDTAIAVGDLYGNVNIVGKSQEKIVSAQSIIKVFLYLYAIHIGTDPSEISEGEAAAIPFNRDAISYGDADRPHHPLNNAGGICSASFIDKWEKFLRFMRKLTGNENLSHLDDIYQSEMKDSASNRRFSAALEAKGITKDGEKALKIYTKSCALGMSVRDLLNAGLCLARGGLNSHGEILFSKDAAVYAMNAMNSFGFYENTGKMTLMQAGTKSLTAKSGVGGFILNVNPGEGAFVTLGHHLDSFGNSVFGMKSSIILNRLMQSPGIMNLSLKEAGNLLEKYENQQKSFTAKIALKRFQEGSFKANSFILDKKTLLKLKEKSEKQIKRIDEMKKIPEIY